MLAVGTSPEPFDRLLRAVDDLCLAGRAPHRVFAQIGHGRHRPRGYEAVPFVPAAELERLIAAARAVICHGGAGIVGSCLQAGQRPVLFPRRAAHREIVNDHQLELCQEMERQGRAYLAEDGEALHRALGEALAARGSGAVFMKTAAPGGAELKARIAALLAQIAAS